MSALNSKADDFPLPSVSLNTGLRWFHLSSLFGLAESFSNGGPVGAAISEINPQGNLFVAAHWRDRYRINESSRYVVGGHLGVGRASYFAPKGAGRFADPITVTTTYASIGAKVGYELIYRRTAQYVFAGQVGVGVNTVFTNDSLTSALFNVRSKEVFSTAFLYSELNFMPENVSGFGVTARIQTYPRHDPDLALGIVYRY